MQDSIYMKRALKLATIGRFTTHPNPNVGCVIVNDGKIVGEGFHYRAGESHAEINALHMAGKKASNATAYITLEPCNHYGNTAPCCEALISAGIYRVVAAMKDPNPQVSGRGLFYLQKKGIKVKCGLMTSEAEKINKGFLKRMRTGFPYVQIKLGASLDGKTAMLSGESKWITSLQARKDAQQIRAQSHAILTSSSTILADDPMLTIRWNDLNVDIKEIYPKKNIRQPLRIVVDSQNRITINHNVIKQPGETWLIRKKKDSQKWPVNVRQILIPEKNNNIDLRKLFMFLGKQKINSILVEAGPTLSGAILQNKLVDELIIYLAPKVLGNKALGLFVLPDLKILANAPEFIFKEVRPIGSDFYLRLKSV